jgi:hypothetical protein
VSNAGFFTIKPYFNMHVKIDRPESVDKAPNAKFVWNVELGGYLKINGDSAPLIPYFVNVSYP